VSRRRQSPVVARAYEPAPNAMADAVALLLRTPCKEMVAGDTPAPGNRDDVKESANGYVATRKYNA
jgi:hypothetical protein